VVGSIVAGVCEMVREFARGGRSSWQGSGRLPVPRGWPPPKCRRQWGSSRIRRCRCSRSRSKSRCWRSRRARSQAGLHAG